MNRVSRFVAPVVLIAVLLGFWEFACGFWEISKFILPAPSSIAAAFIKNFSTLMYFMQISLLETGVGLLIAVVISYITVTLMDRFKLFEHSFSPIVALTQTIPTIAIAPLLILWMGFGISSKITLVAVVCYFPLTVSLLAGFKRIQREFGDMAAVFGLSRWQILTSLKLRGTLKDLFIGLKISVSYAVVSAVVAEWLGGDGGLGVYMMRVRKAYAYDEMFAIIFLVSALSLALLGLVSLLEKTTLKYEQTNKRRKNEKSN